MEKYYTRYMDQLIEKKMKSSGAVLVAGPKFCGKTTTCMKYAKSSIRLNTKSMINAVKLNPKMALEGKAPHLIDEWQKVPDTWNYIKEDLDIQYQFGKFLLTGSSTPEDKSQIEHNGAGRIVKIVMRPMSLYESMESSGKASLQQLFDGTADIYDANTDYSINDTAFLICRGGWPLSLQNDRDVALDVTSNYYSSIFYLEDSENDAFRNKKADVLKAILKSYARNISTEAAYTTILNDVKQHNERTMDEKTFREYVNTLKDLYIIEDMEAWCPNIRSKTTITSTPTRHFVDTSIACCALGLNPSDFMKDLNSFGMFFEDFAVRDLRIYAEMLGGTLRHYRDGAGLECDAVILLPNGKWGAVEIKLGGDELIDYGASRLNLLKNKIVEKSDEQRPSFMMILTGCGPMYRRKDGIYVVPINMLKD